MSEQKSYLDTFVDKPESFGEETFVDVKGKGRHKVIIWLIMAALAAILFLFIYLSGNSVSVPDLTGMTLDEANVWATRNKIVLAVRNLYDFDHESGMVISQDVEAGQNIKKNDTLAISVSLGADPNEKIIFPDIQTMIKSEIESWINENKLTGIQIETANSDVVEADHVISYSLIDGTADDFLRKSRATITLSLGPAT